MKTGALVCLTLAVCLALSAPALAAKAGEQTVGDIKFRVSSGGAIGNIRVAGKPVLNGPFLCVSSSDPSIKGDQRMWQASAVGTKLEITRDPKTQALTIEAEGALVHKKSTVKNVAYKQKVVVTPEGKVTGEYELEYIRELKWRPTTATVSMQVPMTYAIGKPCVLDKRPPVIVPEKYEKKGRIGGRYRTLKVGDLVIEAGEGQVGNVADARAWGNYPRLFVSIYAKEKWYKGGGKPIPVGTKRTIKVDVQLPMKP